ncbi:isochorismatase family protein [Paracoccus sp. CPCC 101403]|uniref:Isochorismatase family protein n=1 Tax=Paracoccus broussonetiae TaxID=3075834 RepID=A0ABU3EE09_9RHOB|nr:isochorismatase family protein [Paracoccus sp. CPCC 101403]MDT1062476.1 isochorismatase family protein [Paracoccus sp. CPCC 101403]
MQALVIIDMQLEIQRRIETGLDHVNPGTPTRIAALADAFRHRGLPVLHVRHADQNPASAFHPASAGHGPMPCAEAQEGEAVFVKSTSSAFASTDLADHLRRAGIHRLVVAGAVAGFCVNSTVRAGADLGFEMTVLRDAILGFGLPDAGLSARTVLDVTLALLEADFARVLPTAEVLARIDADSFDLAD